MPSLTLTALEGMPEVVAGDDLARLVRDALARSGIRPADGDVLVCGDDADARETVIGLARDAGITAWHAGVLANSAASEALTSVLIAINKRYKVPGSGIRITGLPRS